MLCLLGLAFLSARGLTAGARTDIEERFRNLAALYAKGEYDLAAEGYEALVREGYTSGPILFNLGNCYFKQKKLGLAILNYERARKLMPGDASLTANHRYALKMAGVDNAAAGPWDRFVAWVGDSLTTDALALVAWLVLVLLLVALNLSLCMRYSAFANGGRNLVAKAARLRPFAARVIVILAAVCVFLLPLSVWAIARLDYRTCGIIMATETSVRYEPNEKATVYFKLKEGSKIELGEKTGTWRLVRRPDGKQGWVPEKEIGII